jgi:hypothetical protein
LQRGQASAFGIPLVPAHQGAEAAYLGIMSSKAQVAGSEVKLLVIERVVGDMHLAVNTAERAVGIEDRGSVVIDAGSSFFEE